MESIKKFSRIDESTLSQENYFQSLLEKAYALSMLSDTDMEEIQFQCLSILAKQAERFNKGGSSSIRVETGQNMLTSIMFTIGICLKTYPSPDEAIEAIKSGSIEDLFEKGQKHIDTLVKLTKTLHSEVLFNLVDTKNVFYRSTIEDGINGFFKVYSPDFGAHEIHITADYPVYNPMEKLAGIEFIQKYLEYIYFENLFCSHFSPKDIHHLLYGYSSRYEEIPFNIYEPILTTSIGCILSGTDVNRLDLAPSGLDLLNNLFVGKTKPEIEKTLLKTIPQIKRIFSLSQSSEKYIYNSAPQIIERIENATHTGTMNRIFILKQYP